MSFSEPLPSGEEIKGIAELRWKSLEAFLWHYELSLTAARLGALLISAMNSKTRECFPSETRIAAQMGVDRRALQRAKAELKKQNLIDWSTPYGPRGGAYYTFNFEELMNTWERGKLRGDLAVEEQKKENLASRYTSPKRKERLRSIQKRSSPAPSQEILLPAKTNLKAVSDTAIEPTNHKSMAVTDTAIEAGEVGVTAVFDALYGGISSSQSGTGYRLYGGTGYRQTCPSIDPIRHDPLDHDIGQAEVGVNAHPIEASKPKIQEPPKKRCRYPRLIEKFAPDERTADLIMALDLSVQDKADKLRATHGTQAAAKFLESHGIEIKQPEGVAA